ncbi:protein eiger [Hylaeus volcanicus]|uniref:protein eiger n=1 Tax=Hylaeus volcanicus TaxID=313075 RepID=UPI0023B85D5C|nr:protein eiger [Hylaeus volcanicus]
MTSMLSEGETKVAKIKQKMMNDVHVKEESRSFLSFSRENLSISQSELEQGFNKHRFRPDRNTILSVAALTIAFLCFGLETWKLRRSLINAREIEDLKRDVESLKHRFLGEDLLDELKAFEERVYAGESSDDDNSDKVDNDNSDKLDVDDMEYEYADYDGSHWPEYSSDHSTPIYGARPSDFPDSLSTIAPVPSPPEPTSNDAMRILLAAVHKAEVKQELKKNMWENHKNAEREPHVEKVAEKISEDHAEEQKNSTKQKRDVPDTESLKDFLEWKAAEKRKRSIGAHKHGSKRVIASGSSLRESLEDWSVADKQDTSLEVRGRHPPKKYYTHSESVHGALTVDGQSSNIRSTEEQPKKPARRLRKNLHTSRQTFAAHYGADKNLLGRRKNDTGSSRVRHDDRVFKAWRASDWVEGLRMDQHFDMKNNGSLVINKDGLYLVYAQIHYMDEHFEAGFHLEVNDRPILQCMNYNSGKDRDFSQSCFSAQVTCLNKNDILVLKEVGSSSRYALLEAEKSFLGLVRLGDAKTLPFYTSQ